MAEALKRNPPLAPAFFLVVVLRRAVAGSARRWLGQPEAAQILDRAPYGSLQTIPRIQNQVVDRTIPPVILGQKECVAVGGITQRLTRFVATADGCRNRCPSPCDLCDQRQPEDLADLDCVLNPRGWAARQHETRDRGLILVALNEGSAATGWSRSNFRAPVSDDASRRRAAPARRLNLRRFDLKRVDQRTWECRLEAEPANRPGPIAIQLEQRWAGAGIGGGGERRQQVGGRFSRLGLRIAERARIKSPRDFLGRDARCNERFGAAKIANSFAQMPGQVKQIRIELKVGPSHNQFFAGVDPKECVEN